MSIKDRQALLREFVDGTLLSEIYASTVSVETKLAATRHLLAAIDVVWRASLTAERPRVDYVAQIRQRLPDIYSLHPELADVAKGDASASESALDDLLERAERVEVDIAPPFSVWIHGDLNANNVVYQQVNDQIKFVDVHRSRLGDYLQDISVFLVSMERRPDLSDPIRADIETVNATVYEFARQFAAEKGDAEFKRRLKLARARATITSARVIVDARQAEQLLRRGMTLLHGAIKGE